MPAHGVSIVHRHTHQQQPDTAGHGVRERGGRKRVLSTLSPAITQSIAAQFQQMVSAAGNTSAATELNSTRVQLVAALAAVSTLSAAQQQQLAQFFLLYGEALGVRNSTNVTTAASAGSTLVATQLETGHDTVTMGVADTLTDFTTAMIQRFQQMSLAVNVRKAKITVAVVALVASLYAFSACPVCSLVGIGVSLYALDGLVNGAKTEVQTITTQAVDVVAVEYTNPQSQSMGRRALLANSQLTRGTLSLNCDTAKEMTLTIQACTVDFSSPSALPQWLQSAGEAITALRSALREAVSKVRTGTCGPSNADYVTQVVVCYVCAAVQVPMAASFIPSWMYTQQAVTCTSYRATAASLSHTGTTQSVQCTYSSSAGTVTCTRPTGSTASETDFQLAFTWALEGIPSKTVTVDAQLVCSCDGTWNAEKDAVLQCDGGQHCNADCTCVAGYKPSTPPSDSCVLSCDGQWGEVDIAANLQCDGGNNCNSACTCNSGYAPTTPRSANCDPVAVCDGSWTAQDASQLQCDGGYNCGSNCNCLSGYQPASPRDGSCVTSCNGVFDSYDVQCDGGSNCRSDCTCATGYTQTVPRSASCTADDNQCCIMSVCRQRAACQNWCTVGGSANACTDNCFVGGTATACTSKCSNAGNAPLCQFDCFNDGDAPLCTHDCYNAGDANACTENCFNGGRATSCTTMCLNALDAPVCTHGCLNGGNAPACTTSCYNAGTATSCTNVCYNGADAPACTSNCYNAGNAPLCTSAASMGSSNEQPLQQRFTPVADGPILAGEQPAQGTVGRTELRFEPP